MATGRWLVGSLAMTLVIAAGCGAESQLAGGSEPIREPGTLSAPRRPIIVQPVPDGWAVSSAQSLGYLPSNSVMQTLYLPPGSTPERGPALAIGHYGQDSGETLCGFGRRSVVVSLLGPSPGPTRIVRSGSLSVIHGEISTDEPGYVFGREVTEDQLVGAASAALFPEDGIAEIAAHGLPAGFRRVASAPVIPNGLFGEVIELRDANGEASIRIGAYDGDAPADVLSQFWKATVVAEPCLRNYEQRRAHRTVDGTDVYVTGHASQALVDQVAASLITTDDDGFAAFQTKAQNQPASTLLGGCVTADVEPDRSRSGRNTVIVDGTKDGVRWALAMSNDPEQASVCTAYVIDGKVEPGGSACCGPAATGAGNYDIDVLANFNSDGPASGVLHLIGGTVLARATRVVIADGTGATDQATLVRGGRDPSRQYFGGLLYPSLWSQAGLIATVTAYDNDGKGIGRYVTPSG